MKMTKGMKTFLIIAGIAVAGYLVYEWWKTRQTGTNTSLGANVNSIAPSLVGGATGPNSGLTYNQGSTTVNLTLPNNKQSQTNNHQSPPGHKNTKHHTGGHVPPVIIPRQHPIHPGA